MKTSILLVVSFFCLPHSHSAICPKIFLQESKKLRPGSFLISNKNQGPFQVMQPKTLSLRNNENPVLQITPHTLLNTKNNNSTFLKKLFNGSNINTNTIAQSVFPTLQQNANLPIQRNAQNTALYHSITLVDSFVFDPNSGEITHQKTDGTTASYRNIDEMREHLNLHEDTYFPFIVEMFHLQNEKLPILILGIGEGAKTNQREPTPHTLIRRGGHFQLLAKRQNSALPNSQGIYGGGIRLFSESTAEIQFQSRSVNGTSDGTLAPKVAEALSMMIRELLLSFI
ncbi:MAG: hypothetical protein CL678_13755 [Bdellovibrionaceae bacterium]|nr:hypothetical protein [Pseudobdellovibrionaceae bacterium]|tara:strand:+ start:1966 stop:2817 length:852 start_codon:yes stop_codon:yes gene_type:complete